MLVAPSYHELMRAKSAIENLHMTRLSLFNKFLNVIKLTRQLQFGYQMMGALMMDENGVLRQAADDYVWSVYEREIEALKSDSTFQDLKALLDANKQVSYANICRLALGENPKQLVGPSVIK